MADEFTDSPYQPAEDLWEVAKDDLTIVPEWAEPPVPDPPAKPRCAIPMCGDAKPELLRLGCSHFLHASCMGSIFKTTRNPECPMCRDGYLSHIRQIVETNPFTPEAYTLPADAYTHPTDTYGPPELPSQRPPNSTRYGEQFDPTPRSRPIPYGGRYRNQAPVPTGPGPTPGIGKINMMGLEALRYMR